MVRCTQQRALVFRQDDVFAAICLDTAYASHGDDKQEACQAVFSGLQRTINECAPRQLWDSSRLCADSDPLYLAYLAEYNAVGEEGQIVRLFAAGGYAHTLRIRVARPSFADTLTALMK